MARPSSAFGPDVYRQLEAAAPSERASLLLRLIEAHPEGRLVLPPREGRGAALGATDLSPIALDDCRAKGAASWQKEAGKGIHLAGAELDSADLSGANLRLADLEGALLNKADLREANLGGANLRAAQLEEANAEGADLAGADLQEAALGGAILRGAMLEEVDARRAALRFADLRECVLEEATLEGADLWGARLDGAMLAGANLRDARLHEASLAGTNLRNTDLRKADLRDADLRGADLSGADLRGALLVGADLTGARLCDARLQDMDLSDSEIAEVYLSGAWLEKTRLHRPQLGEAIGEELAENYDEARQGYLALERNFEMLGDAEAASWAYRKKRRMQKQAARRRGRLAAQARQWADAAADYARFIRDQFVEWLCDYGESVPRALLSILVVYSVFTLLYGLTGSVVRVADGAVVGLQSARDLIDLMIFSLISMTSSEGPAVGLHPRNQGVHVLTGMQALLSIALTGLLGFVLGNRIRR